MMAEDASWVDVSLIYEGGICDAGEIHLYEYSRAVYNYSRFLQTIEYYRREGVIANRISRKANTDIIIRSPIKGSFIVDASVNVAQKVLPFLRRVPYDAVLTYLLDAVKEDRQDYGLIRRLASIQLKELEASHRLTASTPATIVAEMEALRDIKDGEQPTTRKIREVAGWAQTSNNVAIQRAGVTQKDLQDVAKSAEATLDRQARLRPHSGALSQIPSSDLAKLTSKTRPFLAEIGLPLRKSADSMSVAAGSKRTPLACFDQSELDTINSRRTEEFSMSIVASLKAYDRETGHGRLRLIDDEQVYSFLVPSNLRTTQSSDSFSL